MQLITIIVSLTSLLFIYNNCSPSGFDSTGDFTETSLTLDSGPTDTGGGGIIPPVVAPGTKVEPELGANNSSPYRVLTAQEITNSLESIFGISFDEILSRKIYPEVEVDIFENQQDNITISQPHMDAFSVIANILIEKVSANSYKVLNDKVPCMKSSQNTACRNNVIDYFGPLFLRRALSTEQKEAQLSFLSNSDLGGSLHERTALLLSALVQSTSFVIRREAGIKSGNSYNLTENEIASRLSYFITGAGPDEELLALAKSGQLKSETIRREQAQRLFNSELGKRNSIDINKQIFRIKNLKAPDNVRADLEMESELLFKRILIDKDEPWKNIFTAKGTYVNRSLASNYNMPAPGSNAFKFTNYPDNKRMGILSHGSFLSQGFAGEPENTSPIRRGLQIVEDLLCRHLPPPSDVDVDNDPAGSLTNLCRIEARKETTLHPQGSCIGCHSFMEPLGLGLERFNMLGQYRTVEKERNRCSTIEDGSLNGQSFSDMTQLGNIVSQDQDLDRCLAQRVTEFAFGEIISINNLEALWPDLENFQSDKKFSSLIIDIASSPQFIRRDQ